jgi:tRNA U34 5-methylaminomethyl-2-thiouridine-forming methyltransferase MnmC
MSRAGELDVELVRTEDGSFTLYVPALKEHYHSTHGALAESQHVYIDSGLMEFAHCPRPLKILEIGFGTGLNALLTFRAAQNNFKEGIDYVGLEPYRLALETIDGIGLSGIFTNEKERNFFAAASRVDSGLRTKMSDNFSLLLEEKKLEDFVLEEKFDLIYFDAFAPAVQPELWEEMIFERLYKAMEPGGVLVTYCAQGKFKRALKAAGFVVEGLPGPKGKREITRARKVG